MIPELNEEENAITQAHWAFNECDSVKEANRLLQDGLMGSVEHARYILQVWENFKQLPQYRHLPLK